MLKARGEKIIFSDADGATEVSDVESLEKGLEKISKNGLGVAVGSRHHLTKTDAVVKVHLYQYILLDEKLELEIQKKKKKIKNRDLFFEIY